MFLWRVLYFIRAAALKNLLWRISALFSAFLGDNSQTAGNKIMNGYVFTAKKIKLATYLSITGTYNYLLSSHAILTFVWF